MTISTTTRRGRLVDLFCGAGGLSLGAEQAGFDVDVGVDFEPQHVSVHKRNFAYGSALVRDLAVTSADEIRRAAGMNDDIDLLSMARPIDAVIGGPPCQGFSTMGRRDLDDPRNMLVHHFHRFVHEFAPRYAVMENVAGLADARFRHVLDDLMESYSRIGYNVVPPRVLHAGDYGVPQSRERVILLIYRRGETAPAYPLPTHSRTGDPHFKRTPTVRDALAGLPLADHYPELFDRDEVAISPADLAGDTSLYAMQLRGLANDPTDLSYRRNWNPMMLTSSQLVRHAPDVVARYAAVPQGGQCPGHNLIRLHPDRLAPTLRAGSVSRSYDGKRVSAQTAARPLHPTQPRVITVREGCRLHGVPDWMRMHGTKMSGFRELGNSVPPPMAKAVLAQVMAAAGLNPGQPSDVMDLGNDDLLFLTPTQAAERFAA